MLKGSCLCGKIQYQYTGELGEIALCHCSQCRKAQGGAFATNSPVEAAKFEVVAGEKMIREYESSPGKHRAFCSNCGSPIYSRRDDKPDLVRLRMGTLDSSILEKPAYHIYAGSKAEWWEIYDDYHQYEALSS